MEVVVDAVQGQLEAVGEKIAELVKELDRAQGIAREIKQLRSQQRTLTAALAKLRGDRTTVRERRSARENEQVVETWLARNGAATLTEIARGTELPLSSVRNAVRRLPGISQSRGKLWAAA